MMAHDCVAVLRRSPRNLLMNAFLQRISAWQEFMEREDNASLCLWKAKNSPAGELIAAGK